MVSALQACHRITITQNYIKYILIVIVMNYIEIFSFVLFEPFNCHPKKNGLPIGQAKG